MKKVYIYGGIGAWIAAIALAAAAIALSGDPGGDPGGAPSRGMGEVLTHQITPDETIAVKATNATFQLDSKTPRTCLLGSCVDDRDPGKYTARIDLEVTNLSTERYHDFKGRFELERLDGKRWQTFRPLDFIVGLGGLPKGESMRTQLEYAVDPPLSEYAVVIKADWSDRETRIGLDKFKRIEPELCSGAKACFAGRIAGIMDNGTVGLFDIEGRGEKRISLSLVEPPHGDRDARETYMDVLEGLCPPGSYALFDEDDALAGGGGPLLVGKLYCEGVAANEQVLELGLAGLDAAGCGNSEYAQEPWALAHGCG